MPRKPIKPTKRLEPKPAKPIEKRNLTESFPEENDEARRDRLYRENNERRREEIYGRMSPASENTREEEELRRIAQDEWDREHGTGDYDITR